MGHFVQYNKQSCFGVAGIMESKLRVAAAADDIFLLHGMFLSVQNHRAGTFDDEQNHVRAWMFMRGKLLSRPKMKRKRHAVALFEQDAFRKAFIVECFDVK